MGKPRKPDLKDLPIAESKPGEGRDPRRAKARHKSQFGPNSRLVFATMCDYSNSDLHTKHRPAYVPAAEVLRVAALHFPEGCKFLPAITWVGVPKIGSHTALSDRAVQEGLRELEDGGAIVCIFRSAGGPGRSSCFLLTPHLVRGYETSGAATAATESEHDEPVETPHGRTANPAQNAPKPRTECAPNPALSAPDLNIYLPHRQSKEIEEIKTASSFPNDATVSERRTDNENRSDSNSSALIEEDDEKKRLPLDDPEKEFRARLQERRWKNGPPDIEKTLQALMRALDHRRDRLVAFLEFETDQTSPELIRSPAAHYTALAKGEFPKWEARRRKPAAGSGGERTCALSQCKGTGIVADADGFPTRICECDHGQLYRTYPDKWRSVQAANALVSRRGAA